MSGSLWRERNWRLYYTAKAISVAGSVVSGALLPILMYQLTESAFLTAAVVGLEAVPYILFGLLAGALVDRVDRRRVLVYSDLANAAVMATIPFAAALGALSAGQLLVVAFVSSFLFVWFDAADFGALPTLVGRERLVSAHSNLQATYSVLRIAGPGIAGLSLVLVGAAYAISLDALSYLASACLLLMLPAALLKPRSGASQARNIRADIREGLSYVWHHDLIRPMTFLGLGLSLTGGAVLGLLVVFGSQAIGLAADDPRLPILFLAVGVGSLLGSLTLPRLTARVSVERITLVGLILNPIALVLFAVAPTLETAVGALIVWQAIFIGVIVNGIALRQRETPDELQSRVNVTARMIAWGGTPFGAMIGGLLVELVTVRSAYLLMALPVTVAAIIGWFSPLRAGRGSALLVADPEAHP